MGAALASIFLLVGPFLGLACYIFGPLSSIASACVIVRPWWASPLVGLVTVPVGTLLFTPVCGFCSKALPMPLPWLMAAVVDPRSATVATLIGNGKTLAFIYLVALVIVMTFRYLRYCRTVRESVESTCNEDGG